MADHVASLLLQCISDHLQLMSTPPADKKIVEKLKLTLGEIQTLVAEAEMGAAENEALKSWMTALKKVAYEADDLLDNHHLWMLNRGKLPLPRIRNTVRNFFSLENHLIYRFNLLHKLSQIEVTLKDLLMLWLSDGSIFLRRKTTTLESSNLLHSNSLLVESEIFGKDKERDDLVHMILELEPPTRKDVPCSVIPIVGMGGVGKTTLAQLVYNDDRVACNFELRIWVSVALDFKVSGIGRAIMEQTRGKNESASTLDASIKERLQGKKFLIVLDDVWDIDYNNWSQLERWFGIQARGSVVIITTRNCDVAEKVGTVKPYNILPLTDNDSWCLFKHQILTENPKLLEIGRSMVLKCRGLPLAVRVLGWLLRYEREETEWLRILHSELWYEREILPVLKLSYDVLPPHLKQCFAYCSIFPKDFKINKEKLILLWMAEGFIRPAKGRERLEDIGNDYFMELLQRSFFIDVSWDEFGDIVDCRMHDLVHDLAQYVASIGCSILETDDPRLVSKELRHSSLVGKSEASTFPQELHEATNLRTLLLISCKFESILDLVLNFDRLRTLDLSETGIRKLSATIGTLKHLRYLDLSRTYIQKLPQTISKLKHLQTLELVGCTNLLELPKAICGLINLRNLDIHACSSLFYMPSGIGSLKLLQKLPVFILGENDDCVCLDELRDLDLTGRLEIKNLENVGDRREAVNVNLHEKKNIRSLRLSWGHNDGFSTEMSVQVLESLRPSPYLKVLEVAGHKGSSLPSWIKHQALPNLVKVSLINCSFQELPPLGELPYLEDLYIKGMFEVHHIGDEFYGNGSGSSFPSLQKLELYDMPKLLEWTDKEAFPCLETLTVKGCSSLTALPSFPCLKNLALWNSNEMLLCSLAHLTCLSSLLVHELKKPKYMPQDLGLYSIGKLTIYDCDDMIDFFEKAMQNFTLLNQLSILYCKRLSSLPRGLRYLTSLRKLDIIECRDLAGIEGTLTFLTSLQELTLEGCPLLESLPHGMHYLTHLQKLVIRRCPKLQQFLDTEAGERSFKIDQFPCVERDTGPSGEIIPESET